MSKIKLVPPTNTHSMFTIITYDAVGVTHTVLHVAPWKLTAVGAQGEVVTLRDVGGPLATIPCTDSEEAQNLSRDIADLMEETER